MANDSRVLPCTLQSDDQTPDSLQYCHDPFPICEQYPNFDYHKMLQFNYWSRLNTGHLFWIGTNNDSLVKHLLHWSKCIQYA